MELVSGLCYRKQPPTIPSCKPSAAISCLLRTQEHCASRKET
ncbi:hypothetical protein PVAP13_4KG279205 [Panicum virgatum]|uniref:Uncharacterized protein n=1 Tax=Panicum virgatum TaxID=38727 RepID=A0A8T0TU53_PANVG|nr:hypothetical protein PVAP13_4KG279205 [Panicum virgatum]